MTAPILVIENDADDVEFVLDAVRALGIKYPVRCFSDGGAALEYLRTTSDQPFLILCDIEMPGISGLELRQAIVANDCLRKKSVPFVFFTDYTRRALVAKAYDLTVQGYFVKAHSAEALKTQLTLIVTYWEQCVHPNRKDLN